MIHISLHASSFVGSQCGYQPPHAWDECVQALSDYFRPPETFPARFDALVSRVKSLGFECMDVWQPAELNWAWATAAHTSGAVQALRRHGVGVSSLAGEFGETREEFLSACALAQAIGAPILSGTTALYHTDRPFVIEQLHHFDLRLAIENEVEHTATEMLEEIGDGAGGRVGTALDTGWYASHGYDVVRAVEELRGHILHVHLKDVYPGEEHVNCGYGQGCVPLREVVTALQRTGFSGVISVENHNLDHNPDDELVEGRALLERWLSAPA